MGLSLSYCLAVGGVGVDLQNVVQILPLVALSAKIREVFLRPLSRNRERAESLLRHKTQHFKWNIDGFDDVQAV